MVNYISTYFQDQHGLIHKKRVLPQTLGAKPFFIFYHLSEQPKGKKLRFRDKGTI